MAFCRPRAPWHRSLACRASFPIPSAVSRRAPFSSLTRAETAAPSSVGISSKRPARTRFAPSPTGYMHLGSLRTALFNWLLARGTGGRFILRIEDTDQDRLVPDAEERIMDDLRWAGLTWDEGPDKKGMLGPYCQSERLEHYQRSAKRLIESRKAYRCFCDHRTLDQFTLGGGSESFSANAPGTTITIPDGAFRAATRYPGKCRSITHKESQERMQAGEPFVVRFKSDRRFLFVDAVYGRYGKGEDEEDFVLIKSDGFPTYHFANVVDDALMRITHVVRGDEWLISTPKHIALYDALGLTPPVYAHLGLLVGPSGEKLSKRSGDISVQAYRDKGYDSLTLLNWLALHGSHLKPGAIGGSSEVVPDLATLVGTFSHKFTKGAILPNFKKLHHINMAFLHRTRLRADQDGWAHAARSMSLSVLKTIAAVEQRRTSADPDRMFNFYDNEGEKSGSIDVDTLGPLVPHLAEGLSDPAAYEADAQFPLVSRLGAEEMAALTPASRARYTATALAMCGPIRNAVPIHVVLSASNLVWRPTREKCINSFKTMGDAKTLIGIDYSPITFWELLLKALAEGADPAAVAAEEINRLLEVVEQQGLLDQDQKAKGRAMGVLHSWVRQALAGGHNENTPTTGNMFAFLGPEESALRLRETIALCSELRWGQDVSGKEEPEEQVLFLL